MTMEFLKEKSRLWSNRDVGISSALSGKLQSPAGGREDLQRSLVEEKISRGDAVQSLRLFGYPSIDVDYNTLFAGKINGEMEDAIDKLLQMGYRNNPTAYVEVTEKHGPDDGSYARQIITETGLDSDRGRILQRPSIFKRQKRQIHITIFKIEDEVHYLAHEEKSAWLQPAQHVAVNDSSARIGVRDFRDDWFDEFGEELPGRGKVKWQTTH